MNKNIQKLSDFAKCAYHLGALIEDLRVEFPYKFIEKSAEYSNMHRELIEDFLNVMVLFKRPKNFTDSSFNNLDKKTDKIIDELLLPGSVYQPKGQEF